MKLQHHHKAHLSKFTKFCIVNGGTFVLDLGVARTGLVMGVSAFATGLIGFLGTSVISYYFLHHWVFRDHASKHGRAFFLFAALVAVQALIVGIGMKYLLGHTQLIPEVARSGIGVFVGILGYVVCHYFIFMKK